MIQHSLGAPGMRLFMAALLALLLSATTVWLSTQRLWYGMTPGELPSGEPTLMLPHKVTDSPAYLLAIDGTDGLLTLVADDLIEEPDVFEQQAELTAFLQRQQQLYQAMQHGQLQVIAQPITGEPYRIALASQPSRPISSLPVAFWVQLVTGIGGFLIGCWVLVLRPGDAAARCFMLTGVGLMLSALPAAVYSTRELALDATLFNRLLLLNQAGAIGFGVALMGLFFYFPKRLLTTRWLPRLLITSVVGWVLVMLSGQINSLTLLIYAPVSLLSLLIIGLITVQWWHNRNDPRALASLRWLGLVTFATISCFLVMAAIPVLYGSVPPVSQGTAFGFFLILYAGLALGLRRYRLFELDRWAFHLLLWVLAGLALVGLDLLFLSALQWQQTHSLLLSLLICGFLYLPLRGWLWRKLVERPRPPARALFDAVVNIALAPSPSVFIERWQALLALLYAPLHMAPVSDASALTPALQEDGRSLFLPAVIDAPALQLALAEKGKRLFVPGDVKLAEEILDMLRYAHANRHAREAGEREERRRIAQDLHDDLGARLMTGLHQTQTEAIHDTIGLAIADMRSIVRGLTGEQIPLEQALAELRAETLQRVDNTAIDWPLPDFTEQQWGLDYRRNRQFMSLMRELFSNILRHANASQVRIEFVIEGAQLKVTLHDNGSGYDGSGQRTGSLGMQGLNQRIAELHGSLHFEPTFQGTTTRILLPLDQTDRQPSNP